MLSSCLDSIKKIRKFYSWLVSHFRRKNLSGYFNWIFKIQSGFDFKHVDFYKHTLQYLQTFFYEREIKSGMKKQVEINTLMCAVGLNLI